MELQHAISAVNTSAAERTEAVAELKRKSRFKRSDESVMRCACGCQLMNIIINLETERPFYLECAAILPSD